MTVHARAISHVSYTISDLAQRTSGRLIGDGELRINRVAKLESAGPGEIAYVEDEKFFEAAKKSRASCLIVPIGAPVDSACRIEVKNPKLAFAQIAEVLHPPKQRAPEIHSSPAIADSAKIGQDVFIGAFVCVGEGSSIGDRTQIRAGAKIGDGVTIGDDCPIHPHLFTHEAMPLCNP